MKMKIDLIPSHLEIFLRCREADKDLKKGSLYNMKGFKLDEDKNEVSAIVTDTKGNVLRVQPEKFEMVFELCKN